MWGTQVERETMRRINVAAWALAYEEDGQPLVDDHVFDAECLRVDLTVKTTNKKLDAFFSKHFVPFTGMWVHKHPDKEGLRRVVRLKREGSKMFDNKELFGLGEQKRLAARISKHLNDYTAEKYGQEGHRRHLGASKIGEDCPRALWYSFRWALTPTYVNAKGEDHKGRMMRLFNRGHMEEFRFVEWLRGMGFEVWEFDTDGKTQFRISDVDGHFGGSLDGMVKLPPEYGELPKMLLEFKTSSEKHFDKMKEDGVKLAKPTHYAQMCSYGKRYDLHYALYMMVNKNTDEVYIEIVKLDFAVADMMTEKARQVIHATTPPPKLSENSAYFACKFCDFAPVCHGQAPYEKNCRNCVNSAPVADGQWSCKHYGVIPAEFIKEGADKCSMYTEAR